MLKIAFVDTYYPAVLRYFICNFDKYPDRLSGLISLKFGTADYYSEAFKSYGYDAIDIIGNDTVGQKLYMKERGYSYSHDEDTTVRQVLDYQPDILYCQDLSFFTISHLKYFKRMGVKVLAAQHSCPWAGDDRIGAFDVIFTSFPHYLPKIEALGVRSEFLQIGFGGECLLDALGVNSSHFRDKDVSFVGGVNSRALNGNCGRSEGHWQSGTECLDLIAKEIPTFKWWGYSIGNELTEDLFRTYQGEAWGLDQYKIYSSSKIVVNRHGEIAAGYTNNMRCFESTGCGAMLMTELSKNINDYFEVGKECVTYANKDDLIDKLKYYLAHDDERKIIAEAGHKRTMRDHTYKNILKSVSDTFNRMVW